MCCVLYFTLRGWRLVNGKFETLRAGKTRVFICEPDTFLFFRLWDQDRDSKTALKWVLASHPGGVAVLLVASYCRIPLTYFFLAWLIYTLRALLFYFCQNIRPPTPPACSRWYWPKVWWVLFKLGKPPKSNGAVIYSVKIQSVLLFTL